MCDYGKAVPTLPRSGCRTLDLALHGAKEGRLAAERVVLFAVVVIALSSRTIVSVGADGASDSRVSDRLAELTGMSA